MPHAGQQRDRQANANNTPNMKRSVQYNMTKIVAICAKTMLMLASNQVKHTSMEMGYNNIWVPVPRQSQAYFAEYSFYSTTQSAGDVHVNGIDIIHNTGRGTTWHNHRN